jgi:CHAT domain-containing protein
VPRLPPPSSELAQALSANALLLRGAAVAEASGAPKAQVEHTKRQAAAVIMSQLDNRLALDEILPYVEQAVMDFGTAPEVERIRVMNARMAPLRQAFKATPAVSSGLERERVTIEQAARLKNDPSSAARGDALHREIAARIANSAGVSEQMAMIHVYQAISKQQMLLAFGPKGPLGAAIDEQASHAAQPMADALGQIGSVDLNALGPAFKKAYAGDPTDAERLYRAEFVRSETLHRLRLRQSVDRSELDRQAHRGAGMMLDAVLTMAERNPAHAGIVRLGYEEMLAYKAKSPESERRVAAALAASDDRETRDASEKWRRARERIGTLALRRAQGIALTSKETDEIERAIVEEAAIAGRLAELAAPERGGDKPFDAAEGVSALQRLLGPNEALLSYVSYGHVQPEQMTAAKRWRPSYGAFVLTQRGLAFRSLGEAGSVDQAIESFLVALGDPGATPEAKRAAARALERVAFAPVAPWLQGVARLRVVPDGQLQGVPLAALRDDQGWLAERLDIRYAFSERQLLGEHVPALKAGEPLVLAPGPYADSPTPFTPGRALTQKSFPNLPGSLSEAQRVRALLPKARLLTGAQASEGALFSTRSPIVVHVAGHGVFLPPANGAAGKSRGVLLTSTGARPEASPVDPMIGSALVLAPDASSRNDGFLTAFEVATAPLFGTELVVLSACESGRGDPDRIRGVRGLRQAFFTAGVQSLVVSLWSVNDQTTAELMAAFYERLKAGADRAEALRQASAAVRAKNDDPFLWAPFVLLGRDGPIDFKPKAARSAAEGEDETTRLRRAMTLKRLRRTISRLGEAKWSSGLGGEDALDAHVAANQASEQRSLVLTLLGKREGLSLSVPSYSGPGRYAVETSTLRAGRASVKDPLKVDILKLTAEGSEQPATAGVLQVAQDARASGLIGTFELRFKDGKVSSGSFQLESTEPPVLRPRAP